MEAAALTTGLPISSSPFSTQTYKRKTLYPISLHHPPHLRTCSAPSSSSWGPFNRPRNGNDLFAVACLPSSPNQPSIPKTRLYVSGLSFRTTEESLRNAFETFGQLVEVNLVMDKIANRPRGFAFLRYSTEEESEKAIEGMHGKGDICGSCETQIRAPPKPEPKTILRRLACVLSIIAEDDLEEDGTTTLQC